MRKLVVLFVFLLCVSPVHAEESYPKPFVALGTGVAMHSLSFTGADTPNDFDALDGRFQTGYILDAKAFGQDYGTYLNSVELFYTGVDSADVKGDSTVTESGVAIIGWGHNRYLNEEKSIYLHTLIGPSISNVKYTNPDSLQEEFAQYTGAGVLLGLGIERGYVQYEFVAGGSFATKVGGNGDVDGDSAGDAVFAGVMVSFIYRLPPFPTMRTHQQGVRP